MIEQKENLKIIGLKIDGIRKLNAIEMAVGEKGLVQIKGKNKQGKTSVLDAIEILISGNKHITEDMLTHGKDRAEIIGDLGKFTVKRVLTKNTSRLEITTKEGFAVSHKPQQFLDELINELTFNPRPFLDKSSKEKLQFLMRVADIDVTSIDVKIQQAENDRLYAGRACKEHGKPIEVEECYKVDMSESIAFNAEQSKKQQDISNKQSQVASLHTEVNSLAEQLKDLQAKLDEKKEVFEIRKNELEKLPKPEQLIDLSDQQKVNEKAIAYERYLQDKAKHDALEKKHIDAKEKVEKLRQNKVDKLKEAKLPLDGLEIREDAVYYNGIHSDNWSDSEADRISFELCLAMNPKLRAVFIDRGETYDKESLEELKKRAIENDIQVFITRVDDEVPDEKDENVFYIVEGELV